MFEFLFKYPSTIFRKGQFVLLAPWPAWVLVAAILIAGAVLFWHVRRHHGLLTGSRPTAIWLLETAMVALLLALLWHPAISIATLRTQQNVIALLVDDSRSMKIAESGGSRLEQEKALLKSGLLDALGRRFQIRLYRFGKDVERINKAEQLQGEASASHIGESLKQVLAESSTVPLGAVVLLSDGADNSGGIDLETISEIRGRKIPVHTIGFGREKFARDIEVSDVALPARALADSRVSAQVTLRQNGYSGQMARLLVKEGGRVLASEQVRLKPEGTAKTESLMFNVGGGGPKTLQVSVEPLAGEENGNNNAVNRLINVESRKPRILYIEGEPRWEFKFIRRATEDDRNLQLVSMLRTTPNKIYRQGIGDPKELEEGFPSKAEDLFVYQGLIIGSVEAGYFTPAQQELIRDFASRRGGGILFLGGRFALADGGYAASPLAELMPLQLPDGKSSFHRDQAAQSLTAAGRESVICRLAEDPRANEERWKKMPLLANYNDMREAKAGAVVLMEVTPQGRRPMPLLATENYGRGRTALFATAGSWRWRMWRDHNDASHAVFWQQLLRYLVADSPGQLLITTPRQVLSDETAVELRAEVRDKTYKPLANARVEAHVIGPHGSRQTVELEPKPLEEGVYMARWNAEAPGSYVAEVTARNGSEEIARDVLSFRREDGVAENFRAVQNRELLEKLSEQTGGRYYTASTAPKLADEIAYSEAGISSRETLDLWDMPAVFLAALLLRGAEWVLRRKWGVV